MVKKRLKFSSQVESDLDDGSQVTLPRVEDAVNYMSELSAAFEASGETFCFDSPERPVPPLPVPVFLHGDAGPLPSGLTLELTPEPLGKHGVGTPGPTPDKD